MYSRGGRYLARQVAPAAPAAPATAVVAAVQACVLRSRSFLMQALVQLLPLLLLLLGSRRSCAETYRSLTFAAGAGPARPTMATGICVGGELKATLTTYSSACLRFGCACVAVWCFSALWVGRVDAVNAARRLVS